ncbi:hypothetical protein J1N35_043578 [Gossypium stocksii]|uniref:RING-type E3 ubiquitin transferase n=1 Tax=Gossypium stocksii TaxID=47602 RepID=A0A9D3U7S1_9ROSI|nr:hypothetical protein J1N35_043578 [Gossypium stocksii]
MASIPYEYDIFHQHTFEDNIISQSHDISPRFINVELTIDFVFVSVHHDCLADTSTITSSRCLPQTFRFELDIMENQYQVHRFLSPTFTRLQINTASDAYHSFVHDIFVRRALVEPASEFESSNYGMVPAKESLVKEMLKMVKVKAGDEEDCIICLEELEVGFYASRMPCSHTFHGDCIEKWLKQSHYCRDGHELGLDMSFSFFHLFLR